VPQHKVSRAARSRRRQHGAVRVSSGGACFSSGGGRAGSARASYVGWQACRGATEVPVVRLGAGSGRRGRRCGRRELVNGMGTGPQLLGGQGNGSVVWACMEGGKGVPEASRQAR